MPTCGIYRVRNKANGKYYIGQSKNIELRWQYHLIRLRVRTHKSKTLQHDYNEWLNRCYIEPTPFPLIVEVLLPCEEKDLIRLEEIFIAVLKPQYNTNLYKHLRRKYTRKFIYDMWEKYVESEPTGKTESGILIYK